MEVRPDKSGAAFGWCPLCSQQLRVGAERDRMFRENWGLPLTNDAPVTVTDTEATGEAEAQAGPAPVEVPAASVPDTVAEPEPPARPASKRAPSCLLDA